MDEKNYFKILKDFELLGIASKKLVSLKFKNKNRDQRLKEFPTLKCQLNFNMLMQLK